MSDLDRINNCVYTSIDNGVYEGALSEKLQSEADASVYVIGPNEGPMKIGVAANAESRRSVLQVASLVAITTHHERRLPRSQAFAVERHAHWLLRECRVRGEWFSANVAEATAAVTASIQAVSRGDGHKIRQRGGKVGRPPIKTGMKMVKQTVWLDPPLVARIIGSVGARGMSEFMREAAEAELKRRERAKPKGPSDADRAPD